MSGPFGKFVWTLVVVSCAVLPIAYAMRPRTRRAFAPSKNP